MTFSRTPPHLRDAGEHGEVLGVRPPLLHEAVHVRGELVEEMVDDVRRENPNPGLVRVFPSLVVDLHIESEDRCVLRSALQRKQNENKT